MMDRVANVVSVRGLRTSGSLQWKLETDRRPYVLNDDDYPWSHNRHTSRHAPVDHVKEHQLTCVKHALLWRIPQGLIVTKYLVLVLRESRPFSNCITEWFHSIASSFLYFDSFTNKSIMRQRRSPRVDLSADMLDSTSLQESFLLENTQRKIDLVSRSEYKVHQQDAKNETADYDDNFSLHCTSPVSHTSTITMDLLSPASCLGDTSTIAGDDGDDLHLPALPSLRHINTNVIIVTDGPETSFPPLTSPSDDTKVQTVFVDDDSFTYVTLEETNSSCGDVFKGIPIMDTTTTRTPFRSTRATTTPCFSVQTLYTYETIESSDVNRTGFATQYTYETLQSMEKENTPNRSTSSETRKHPKCSDDCCTNTLDLQAQSPLEGRRMYSVSPSPESNSTPKTPNLRRRPNRVELDLFSVDEYASSPDKSVDCFSIDSYSSSDNGLGFGGTGATALELARTKRDQSLFRLRFLGGETFQSSVVRHPLPSPSQSHTSNTDTSINQRKDHVEKQRRRLSQVVQSYCQIAES